MAKTYEMIAKIVFTCTDGSEEMKANFVEEIIKKRLNDALDEVPVVIEWAVEPVKELTE